MSELRSAIESWRTEVLPDLPDARIEEDFAELQRVGELIELERLRRLAEIERRGLFGRDGHLSAAAWLADRFRVAWGSARGSTRTARSLDRMPAIRRAVEAGEVTMSAARVLVEAREANPSAFERSEEHLVEAARIHSVADLQRVASFWRQRVERETDPPGEDGGGLRGRRRLHASVTFQGMVRVDGDLDPEAGETLLTALGAVMNAEVRRGIGDEARTPAQRRADALHEICRQWLDRSDRPTVGGERPHLTMTVAAEVVARAAGTSDLEAARGPAAPDRVPPSHGVPLSHEAVGVAELDHVGPIGGELVRRLACDASVMRIVMAGASQPLDVGRRTPVVPPAMRRAVIARDRRCRFPGCDRPIPGVMSITSCTGPTAAPRRFRTSCSCAGLTTDPCTNAAASAWIYTRACRSSDAPTGPCSRIARRREAAPRSHGISGRSRSASHR